MANMLNFNKLQIRFGLLLSFLVVLLAFQSCKKDTNTAKPGTDAAIPVGTVSIPNACKQVCLVANQRTYVGAVGVMTKNGDVLVTYKLGKPNVYLTEVHVDIFATLAQLQAAQKLGNEGAIANKFAFTQAWNAADKMTTYTVTVPKAYVDQLNSDCFFVASQAVLSSGETAWGGLCTDSSTGVSSDAGKQFPGSNGSIYFEFCKGDCAQTVDFTYAWEDLRGSGNDSDYNDLVVQSRVSKSTSELKIDFTATARGSSYDHKVRFRVPKTGVIGIFGAASYTQDASYYYVTVFESTKAALPALGSGGSANAEVGPACVPFARKQVVLTLDKTFVYDSTKPYEPFISVYDSGNATQGTAYDLYIYEVSNRDTWTATNGKAYPNGILIPSDWRWPLEGINIARPYPRFTSLTDGFTANWANTLTDPSKTFDKSICQ